MYIKYFIVFCLFASQFLFSAIGSASVVVSGTRVIYQLPTREVTVQLTNKNSTPALMQAWLDDGDHNSGPDSVDTPFFVSPPLFRLDPQQGQSLRIAYTPTPEKTLAKDRESVFWLNILEIPPKPTVGEGTSYLNFALRTRLKLFLRPEGLPGKADAAADALLWRLVPGDPLSVECENPTAFHVSMPKVEAVVGDKAIKLGDGVMIAPKQVMTLKPLEETGATGKPDSIKFSHISDFGVKRDKTVELK